MSKTGLRLLSHWRLIVLIAAYSLAALFIISLIQSPGLINERAGVTKMVDFAAQKPFVYRVFVPLMIRAVEIMTPSGIHEPIESRFSDYLARHSHSDLARMPQQKIAEVSRSGYRIIVFILINWMFLVAFLFSLRYLAKTLNLFSSGLCDLLPLGMAVVMPIYFDYGNFIYDFSALFFFTLGLTFLYQNNWKAYLPLFAIAILNKETAALLIVIFVIYYFGVLPKDKFWRLLLIQSAIFIVIKTALAVIFIDNAGSGMEWHLARNLSHLSTLANYFRFESIGVVPLAPGGLNIPLPRGLNLPMLAIIAFLVFFGWKQKPRLLRVSAIIVPIFAVVGIFTCFIDELRSYYEALPVVYLLGLAGAYCLIYPKNKRNGFLCENVGQ